MPLADRGTEYRIDKQDELRESLARLVRYPGAATLAMLRDGCQGFANLVQSRAVVLPKPPTAPQQPSAGRAAPGQPIGLQARDGFRRGP